MRIAQDPKILDAEKGYKIPFHSKFFQSKIPSQPILRREGEEFVKLEVKKLLKKGTITKIQPSKRQFLSNLFFPKQKDGGQIFGINLKQLNAYIHTATGKGDYMCKLDLKTHIFQFQFNLFASVITKLPRVFLPLLRFGTSTTNIPKIVKSVNESLTLHKHQSYNLFRHLLFPVYHKLEKVCVDTSAGNSFGA